MDVTLDALLFWLINLILPEDGINTLFETNPMFMMAFIFGTIVLVLMTVSFLFKFILKLVDR